jgi:hypothetical protein
MEPYFQPCAPGVRILSSDSDDVALMMLGMRKKHHLLLWTFLGSSRTAGISR